MVFDFFKERTQEGFDQLNNLADSAYKGQLGRGLNEAAVYAQQANKAFVDGLAKSRNRLLQNLETLFTGIDPEELLEELEDILLQSDLGAATASEIVAEVESLRDASGGGVMSKDDLMSVLRGKLVETLNTQESGAIRFSTTPGKPTVLFIMGAVRLLIG